MIISYVNAHKMLVPPIVLVLMYWFHNWSIEAFVYLGLHGTYAMLWLVKEASYPDKRFQERLPFWIGTFFVFVPLGGYYIAPYLLISRHVSLQPWVFGFALCCYTVGIFLHYVGDAQKYYTLRLRSGLIEDGLFARTRNPNYLGETLIYISFAILSWHWLPFLVLGGWLCFFIANMRRKDRSLARYPGFAAYKARTGIFLPSIAGGQCQVLLGALFNRTRTRRSGGCSQNLNTQVY
jgi:protein-S-isoprenylcysteine O-methyltransferase Ste14